MSSTSFKDVTLLEVLDGNRVEKKVPHGLVVQVLDEQENLLVRFRENETSAPLVNLSIELYRDSETSRFGAKSYVIRDDSVGSCNTTLLEFERESDVLKFSEVIRKFKLGNRESVFAQRTDDSSAAQYFQFYGYLSQQQNMMQDFIRTSTYQKAIISNSADFRDKVVLDVGAGSGILSFFAVQSGARKVYAVEASSMAKHAELLVFNNKLQNKIQVIPGKIEEITIPESVDIIISEPMGYMLFNERMLETYLHAKKWLRPGGKMFPSRGDLHIAPFSDAALYMEQLNKANFWYQESFHGVDLSSLRSAAVIEYFRQPIVDTFDIRICGAKSYKYSVDFESIHERDLHRLDIPFTFQMLQSGEVHGLAFWFDVAFLGSQQAVWLSTAPTQPLTHWYQVRCLVDTPLFLHRGQLLTGRVVLTANKRQSYDVELELVAQATGTRVTNTLDLKNPYFRYTGQAPQPPPGTYETSPSEQFWATLDQQQQASAIQTNGVTLMNGSTPSLVDVTQLNQSNHNMNNPPQQHLQQQQHTQQHPQHQQQQQQMHQQQQQQSQHQQQQHLHHQNQQHVVLNQNHPGMASGMGVSTSPGGNNRSSPGLSRLGTGGSQVPCSIGGGISPSLFVPSVAILNSANFPVSNNLMIGDYAVQSAPGVNHHQQQHGVNPNIIQVIPAAHPIQQNVSPANNHHPQTYKH